jgi:epsin
MTTDYPQDSQSRSLLQLERFEFLDKTGRDQGINVRQKAKNVCELLSDDDRIRAERKTAKSNRDRYKGIGNPNFDGYDEGNDGDDFERRREGGSNNGGRRTEGRFYDDDEGDGYERERRREP